MYVSDTLFGQKRFSFGNPTHVVFFNKRWTSLQKFVKVLKLKFQNPRNLDEKDGFFHTIHTKTTSNSQWNKN